MVQELPDDLSRSPTPRIVPAAMDAIPVTQVLSHLIVAHSKWTSGKAHRGIALKAREGSVRAFVPASRSH